MYSRSTSKQAYLRHPAIALGTLLIAAVPAGGLAGIQNIKLGMLGTPHAIEQVHSIQPRPRLILTRQQQE